MDENLLIEEKDYLIAKLEALLFVAPEPLSSSQLAEVLALPNTAVDRGLLNLSEKYSNDPTNNGLRLVQHKGKYQLSTAPEISEIVEKFLGLEFKSKLSKAALETLAIIIYRQPITRPKIDAIRGVNSDSVVRNLFNRGLITEVGRDDSPGRPIVYSSTPDFLHYFGINSLEEMPPIEEGENETN